MGFLDKRYRQCGTFRQAVVEDLPLQAGEFDLVFMGLVLHETDDALAALRETFWVGTQRVAILEWPDEDTL